MIDLDTEVHLMFNNDFSRFIAKVALVSVRDNRELANKAIAQIIVHRLYHTQISIGLKMHHKLTLVGDRAGSRRGSSQYSPMGSCSQI